MLSLVIHGGVDAFVDYLSAHVLTCLVPAFFIAGAIGVFVSQASVIKYFGAQAKKTLSYCVASVSGTVLAVCSCTVLPLFSGIYQRGAGIGPATAFLYSGPAINVLAIVYSARLLGLESEKKFMGYGVSACATCDGFFFRGKEIVVSGGGDAAMEEALFLSRFVDKITVVVRRDELRASKIMQERVKKNSKVSFLWNTEIREVLGDGQKLTSLRLWNNKTEEESIFLTNGLFVAIGHKPNTSLFEKWIALDEKGYIRCEEGSTRTNIEGIFAAGDVADHVYRQAITAAGTGCMAAIDIERWLGSR